MPRAAITTEQFVPELLTSQRAARVVLVGIRRGLGVPECLLEQGGPADSGSLFTLLNISWRVNARRMRDRVNIAVKIKR